MREMWTFQMWQCVLTGTTLRLFEWGVLMGEQVIRNDADAEATAAKWRDDIRAHAAFRVPAGVA